MGTCRLFNLFILYERITANDPNSTYFIYGSFCFSMFIFTWFFVPETKGVSLEKMDVLFGQVETKSLDEEQRISAEVQHATYLPEKTVAEHK